MDSVETRNEQYGIQSSNETYNTPSALQMRLSVQDELAELRQSLIGEHTVYAVDDKGEIVSSVVKEDGFVPLMNKEGVAAIMTFVRGFISPHNAMGNVNRDDYGVRMSNIARNIARLLHLNKQNWEMTTESITYIYPLIVHKIGFFLTRAVDDGERKSMSVHIAHSDISRQKADEGKKGLFKS